MESEETGCFGTIAADPAAATAVIIAGVLIEAAARIGVAVAVTAAEVRIVAIDLIGAGEVATEAEIARSTESE